MTGKIKKKWINVNGYLGYTHITLPVNSNPRCLGYFYTTSEVDHKFKLKGDLESKKDLEDDERS